MKKFYLTFESYAGSPHARRPTFRIEIECESLKDAHLIGERMAVKSWHFLYAEEAA